MDVKSRLMLFFLLLFCPFLAAIEDPLPSWNEGPNKQAILSFVDRVTTEGSADFVSPECRIAVFDQDGTLWVEQPQFPQFVFVLDQVKLMANDHPEWKDEMPYKAVLENQHLTEQQIAQLLTVTHSGMSLDKFRAHVAEWLAKAIHPRFKKRYTELVYLPMLEVIRLLNAKNFKTYIVSGGGQEFIRVYALSIYGFAPDRIIGTADKVDYVYQDGHPILKKLPQVLFVDDKKGKPESINLFIGNKPIAAFGNSVGDREMLEWTRSGEGARFALLVHHDDAEREYAYGPDSKIGTFSDALMKEAEESGWYVVSMKRDWKKIFSEDHR